MAFIVIPLSGCNFVLPINSNILINVGVGTLCYKAPSKCTYPLKTPEFVQCVPKISFYSYTSQV